MNVYLPKNEHHVKLRNQKKSQLLSLNNACTQKKYGKEQSKHVTDLTLRTPKVPLNLNREAEGLSIWIITFGTRRTGTAAYGRHHSQQQKHHN